MGQILPYTFKYGKGKGLYSLTRENVSASNIVTRLKVRGSTENITNKYRSNRLLLPGKSKGESYIEDAAAIAKYGVYEAAKIFDIKPTFTGHVETVSSILEFVDTSVTFGNSGFIPLRIDKIAFPCSFGLISVNFCVVCSMGGGVAPA